LRREEKKYMSEQDKKGTSTQSPRKESLDELVFADPWLKKAEKTEYFPDDARFACAYEIHPVVEYFAVATFLRRTETIDELWVGATVNDRTFSAEDFKRVGLWGIGRVFAITRKGDELTACLKLIELLFRARHGFEWPEAFLVTGIVDESSFTSTVRKIEKELDENKQKARETETAIIEVARNLGLSPKPTGEGPSHWFARCPGKINGKTGSHVLFINAAEDSFGCGWCRRKGGVEELRAFVKERKDGKQRIDKNIDPIVPSFFNKGLTLYQLDRSKEAAVWFRRVLEINPNDTSALNLLGQALDADGKFQEAVSCLKEAIKIDTEYALGYYDLGVILSRKKDGRAGAMRCFKKALSLPLREPFSAYAIYSIACLHALAGRKKEAFDSLEQALERGYPNRKYIDEDKDLDGIRRDARFTEMMKKYFGK
jgi:Flp pilus assembly protein TadD, contains TPR repeats